MAVDAHGLKGAGELVPTTGIELVAALAGKLSLRRRKVLGLVSRMIKHDLRAFWIGEIREGRVTLAETAKRMTIGAARVRAVEEHVRRIVFTVTGAAAYRIHFLCGEGRF